MDADPQQQQLVRKMADLEGQDVGQQVQSQRGDGGGVAVAVASGKTAGHDVVVGDGLHFVDVVRVDDVVEEDVQIVEKVDHLENSARLCV